MLASMFVSSLWMWVISSDPVAAFPEEIEPLRTLSRFLHANSPPLTMLRFFPPKSTSIVFAASSLVVREAIDVSLTKAVGDEVKIGRRGSVSVELTVHGKQGHAAYGQLADNPVPKLARMIDRLSSTPLDAGTDRFQPSSVEATVVTVPNSAVNVIPAWARAAFSIRYNDLLTRPAIEAWVREEGLTR